MGETTGKVTHVEDLDRSYIEPLPIMPAGQSHEHVGDSSQEATEIRSGIERTRSNLSATIDALQDKLDPTRIAEQVKDQIREKATEAYDTAKDAVREATIGKAEKIVSSVSEAVTDMTGRAGTVVSDTSSSVVQYIRDNPMSFALVGIGLGMLAMNKRHAGASSYHSTGNLGPSLTERAMNVGSDVADSARGGASSLAQNARAAAQQTSSAVSSAASTVRDAVGNAADATQRQFHGMSDQARQGARVAKDRLKNTWQDNPMALGVAALAAGALVGLTLPSTQVEGEYMGEARDRLVDQAKSVAQDAAGKVQRVAEQAGHTVQDAAQKEGLAG